MECPGRIADDRIVENARKGAGQLPGTEERRPVDPRRQIADRHVVEDDGPGLRRPRRRIARPVEARRVGAGRRQIGLHAVASPAGMAFAQRCIGRAGLGDESGLALP